MVNFRYLRTFIDEDLVDAPAMRRSQSEPVLGTRSEEEGPFVSQENWIRKGLQRGTFSPEMILKLNLNQLPSTWEEFPRFSHILNMQERKQVQPQDASNAEYAEYVAHPAAEDQHQFPTSAGSATSPCAARTSAGTSRCGTSRAWAGTGASSSSWCWGCDAGEAWRQWKPWTSPPMPPSVHPLLLRRNATWEMLVNIAIYNMSDDQPSTSASGFSCETWTLEWNAKRSVQWPCKVQSEFIPTYMLANTHANRTCTHAHMHPCTYLQV